MVWMDWMVLMEKMVPMVKMVRKETVGFQDGTVHLVDQVMTDQQVGQVKEDKMALLAPLDLMEKQDAQVKMDEMVLMAETALLVFLAKTDNLDSQEKEVSPANPGQMAEMVKLGGPVSLVNKDPQEAEVHLDSGGITAETERQGLKVIEEMMAWTVEMVLQEQMGIQDFPEKTDCKDVMEKMGDKVHLEEMELVVKPESVVNRVNLVQMVNLEPQEEMVIQVEMGPAEMMVIQGNLVWMEMMELPVHLGLMDNQEHLEREDKMALQDSVGRLVAQESVAVMA